MWMCVKTLQVVCILSLSSGLAARHLKKKSNATKKDTNPVPINTVPTRSVAINKTESNVAPQLRKQLQAFFKLEDEVEQHLTPEQKKQMQLTKSQVRLKASELLNRLVTNSTTKPLDDSAKTAKILKQVVTAGSIEGTIQHTQEHKLPAVNNASVGQPLQMKTVSAVKAVGTINGSNLALDVNPVKVNNFSAPGKVLKEDTAYWKSLAQSFESMAHELQQELKDERAKSNQNIAGLASQNSQLRQQIMYFYSRGSHEEEREDEEEPEDEDEEEEGHEREMDGPEREMEGPEQEMEGPWREMEGPGREMEGPGREDMEEMYNKGMEKQMHPIGRESLGYPSSQATGYEPQAGYMGPQMRNVVAKVGKQPGKQPAKHEPHFEQKVTTADTLQKISVIQKPATL